MKKGQKYKTGDIFGKITLVEMVKRDSPRSDRKRSGWLAKCECGEVSWYDITNLTKGNTKQCKTCAKITRAEKKKTHGALSKNADKKMKKLYAVWSTMKARCNNENTNSFESYGARGVKVCKRWEDSFEVFMNDMGFPEEGQSIDRIDTNGNYEPSNCKWSDSFEQGNNKRNNVRYEYNGEMITISEAAKIAKVEYDFIKQRIQKGFTMEQAIKIKKGKRRVSFMYFVEGEIFSTLQEVANKHNMAITSVSQRVSSKSFPKWTRKELLS